MDEKACPSQEAGDHDNTGTPRSAHASQHARAPRPARRSADNAARLMRLNWTLAAKCLVVGLIGGALVALYRLGVEKGVDLARMVYGYAAAHPWAVLPIAAATVAAGLLVARLVAWEPMASGSGIPQTEGVLSFVLKMRWWSILAVRFVGGLLAAAFGLSLGREGPSVQVGAAAGQAVDHAMGGRGGLEETCLVTAGCAAGLSAAFSAPLSGLVFALEEMHRSFSPLFLLTSAAASVVAATLAQTAFGMTPVLSFVDVAELRMADYVWVLPLGLACGLVGCLVNRALLGSQRLYRRLPATARPCVAFVLALPVGLFLPELLGGGSNLVELAEGPAVALGYLLVLLVAKTLFTCTSFGAGTPGGIFMPTLAIGALAGGAVCQALVAAGFLPAQYAAQFAVCGMAATFAACVKAPVTGILLTLEMTGSLTHLLPVTLCVLLALLVSDALHVAPIYNVLLDGYVETHGRTSNADDPERLFQIEVQPGSPLDGSMLSETELPASSVVVSVHKAERTVVPRPTTRIRAGDLLIAVPLGEREEAKRDLRELAER